MKNFFRIFIPLAALAIIATSCTSKTTDSVIKEIPPVVSAEPSPSPTPAGTPKIQATPAPTPGLRPALSWEIPEKPERKAWSDRLWQLALEQKGKFAKAADLIFFCPKYSSLSERLQTKAIAELVIAVAYFESSYWPTSRFQEKSQGIDAVTKQPVYSEGLLQLSYQDRGWAPWCRFDWEKDKLLSPTDPKKTILDPIVNLDCGVVIMANQAAKRGLTQQANYWSTLRLTGKANAIAERLVSRAPGCF